MYYIEINIYIYIYSNVLKYTLFDYNKEVQCDSRF